MQLRTPPLYTCEAVLAEAHFLLRRTTGGRRSLVGLLGSGRIELTSIVAESLDRVGELMLAYADVPMSFADACLVCMCEQMGGRVFTLDGHFGIYRMRRNKRIDLTSP